MARVARLSSERDAAERALVRLDGLRAQLDGERAAAEADWRAAWSKAAIEPGAPSEMRGWLERRAQLVALHEQRAAVERERAELSARLDEQRAALCAELAAVGEEAPAGDDLASLVEAAEEALGKIEGEARLGADLARDLAELSREANERADERRLRDGELAAWRAECARAAAAIELPPDAAPDDAVTILDELSDLFRKVDEAAGLRRRVEGMERDARQFAADVARLAAAHAPELGALPSAEGARQLLDRLRRGAVHRTERASLDEQQGEARRALEEQGARRERAEARLAELVGAAAAGDEAGLLRAEERSTAARALDRDLRDVEEKLAELSEGGDVAALEQGCAGLDGEAAALRLDTLDGELREREEARDRVEREVGALSKGIEELQKGESLAALRAAEAQGELSRARSHAERYLRLRAAALLLGRQIDRYREENQGPILARASALFCRLTLGAWDGLQQGWDADDRAVLRCVRAGGREVEVGGLSDGTRDQLYLALRLASLHRHADAGEPLPLVVDDVLIHFDDARATAALRELGELSARMQVLFFTHHARLSELAREAVPRERLREHVLGA